MLLESLEIDRVFFRHRFTAGYVSELLINGFKRPHGLLNAYVQHFTGFNVTDASTFVKAEGSDALPLLSQYKLDFSKAEEKSVNVLYMACKRTNS
jgi:hypothetical protein